MEPHKIIIAAVYDHEKHGDYIKAVMITSRVEYATQVKQIKRIDNLEEFEYLYDTCHRNQGPDEEAVHFLPSAELSSVRDRLSAWHYPECERRFLFDRGKWYVKLGNGAPLEI